MNRISLRAAVVAGALIFPTQPAWAQAAAQTAECIDREQAERLVTTLRSRTEQLRDAAGRLQRAEEIVNQANARIAAAEARAAATQEIVALAAMRNRELVQTGLQILADYQSLSLGQKAAAREPLTGLYRVRLENKLQQFEDELAAAQFFPEKALEEALSEAGGDSADEDGAQ